MYILLYDSVAWYVSCFSVGNLRICSNTIRTIDAVLSSLRLRRQTCKEVRDDLWCVCVFEMCLFDDSLTLISLWESRIVFESSSWKKIGDRMMTTTVHDDAVVRAVVAPTWWEDCNFCAQSRINRAWYESTVRVAKTRIRMLDGDGLLSTQTYRLTVQIDR